MGESTRRTLWAYLFVSPFYISFALFGVFPIGFGFYLAFTRWTPDESVWVGLANFANLARDGLVHQALFNSLWLMAGIGPVDWLGYVSGSGAWIKPAVALVTIWQYFGWNVLLFTAGLQAIPREISEAARIDGASEWHVLSRITLPLLSRVTFFVASITIIGSMQLFDAPLMLLGGVAGA